MAVDDMAYGLVHASTHLGNHSLGDFQTGIRVQQQYAVARVLDQRIALPAHGEHTTGLRDQALLHQQHHGRAPFMALSFFEFTDWNNGKTRQSLFNLQVQGADQNTPVIQILVNGGGKFFRRG